MTIFSTYLPQVLITTTACDPSQPGCSSTPSDPADCDHDGETTNFCTKSGTSRLFVVGTTNAISFMTDGIGNPTRYAEVSGFVTSPFSEVAQGSAGGVTGTGDEITASQAAVMEALKDLFPANCKFANQRVDIKTLSSDTQLQRIVSIPVCIIDKNWKEF